MNILLCKGTSLISKAIEWQTRGPYSHAVVFHAPSCTAWESREGKGVYQSDFRGKTWAEIEKSYGAVDAFEVVTTPEQDDVIIMFCNRQLGKRYDCLSILRFLTRQQEARSSSGKWFCSELVFAAFAKAGIDLFVRTEPWEVSPSWLHRSPLVYEVPKPSLTDPSNYLDTLVPDGVLASIHAENNHPV